MVQIEIPRDGYAGKKEKEIFLVRVLTCCCLASPVSDQLVDSAYGWTILGAGVVPYIGLIMLGGKVMSARKQYNVQYPNLYATPGHHKALIAIPGGDKNADDFNNIQRGHQACLEHWTGVTALSLIGGLKHPIACGVAGVLWTAGRYLFAVGYQEGAEKRYGKGGAIMWIGVLTSLVSTCKLAYDLISSK